MPTVRRYSRRLIKPEVNRSFGKSENDKIYNRTAWRKLSRVVKSNSPLCIQCLYNDEVKACDVTDHIIPVEKGGSFTDHRNLTTLCESCHNRKSAKEKKSGLYYCIEAITGMVPNPDDITLIKIFPIKLRTNEAFIYSSYNVDIGGGLRSDQFGN